MTKDSRGARTPSRLKSSGDLRFLGRCPPVLGLVARQFLGWSPVSFLSRVSSCESKLGLCGRVCYGLELKRASSLAGEFHLEHVSIGRMASRRRACSCGQAGIGRGASRCRCHLIKLIPSSCSLAHE